MMMEKKLKKIFNYWLHKAYMSLNFQCISIIFFHFLFLISLSHLKIKPTNKYMNRTCKNPCIQYIFIHLKKMPKHNQQLPAVI